MISLVISLVALAVSIFAVVSTTRDYRETRRQEARTYRASARTFRAVAEMDELRGSHEEATAHTRKASDMDAQADQIEQRYGRARQGQEHQ